MAAANDKRGFILNGGVGSSLMCLTRNFFRPGCETKKVSLAVEGTGGQFYHSMFTSIRIFLTVLSLGLVLATTGGCFHWGKNAKPKESSAIASEVEAGFKQRFVDKRAGELTAQGVGPEAARAKATEEFRAKYGFTGAAQK